MYLESRDLGRRGNLIACFCPYRSIPPRRGLRRYQHHLLLLVCFWQAPLPFGSRGSAQKLSFGSQPHTQCTTKVNCSTGMDTSHSKSNQCRKVARFQPLFVASVDIADIERFSTRSRMVTGVDAAVVDLHTDSFMLFDHHTVFSVSLCEEMCC